MILLSAMLLLSPVSAVQSVEPETSAERSAQWDTAQRREQVRAVEAVIASGNKRRMMIELQSLGDTGNAYAAWQLGVFLDTGQHYIPVDPGRAFRLFEQAAAQGEHFALVSLGLMHALGRGTPVDYAASMRSYRAGADAGQAHGYYGIGVLHASAQGVDQDLTVALSNFLVAAAMQDREAERPIAILLRMMTQEKIGDAVRDANSILAAAGHDAIVKYDETGYSIEPRSVAIDKGA